MEGSSDNPRPDGRPSRRWLLTLLAVALPLLLYRLGAKDVWEASDARPLESAREMRAQGDPLVQYTNGAVDLTKPPLYAWLVTAAWRATGTESEWAARLPSVLAALGVLAVTFVLARRVAGPRAAFLAGFLLLTQARFLWQARLSELETLLALGVVLAYAALDLALAAPPGRRRALCFAGFHAATGFAFAVKGPVALALVLPGAIAAAVATRRGRALLSPACLATLPLLAVVGLPWYAAVVLRDRASLDVFLSFAAGENVGHLRDPFFYLWDYPLFALPWTPFVIGGLARVVRGRVEPARHATLRVCAFGFLATFVAMSCVHAKQSHYLIPIYALAAVPAGVWLDGALTRNRETRAVVGVWALVCLVTVGHLVPWFNGWYSSRRFMEEVDRRVPANGALAWTVFGSHSDYLWHLSAERVGTRGIPELVGKDDAETVSRVLTFLSGDGPRYAIVFDRQAVEMMGPGVSKVAGWYRATQEAKSMTLVANARGAAEARTP